MILIVYALVSTALYFLGSWALVTSWLWSRYPERVRRFMDCAACSGFWFGVACAAIGGAVGYRGPFEGPLAGPGWMVLSGLVTMVTTPILAWPMIGSLHRLNDVGEAASGETAKGDDAANHEA